MPPMLSRHVIVLASVALTVRVVIPSRHLYLPAFRHFVLYSPFSLRRSNFIFGFIYWYDSINDVVTIIFWIGYNCRHNVIKCGIILNALPPNSWNHHLVHATVFQSVYSCRGTLVRRHLFTSSAFHCPFDVLGIGYSPVDSSY